MKIATVFYFFSLLNHTSCAQDLRILALPAGITLCGSGYHMWSLGIKPRSAVFKADAVSILSLQFLYTVLAQIRIPNAI